MRVFAVLFLMFFCMAAVLPAAESNSAAEIFLKLVRSRSASQNSFADLAGTITHLKRNQGGAKFYPVRFLIRFGKEKVQAKLFLNNKEEHYFEKLHNASTGKSSANVKDGGLLSKLGFRIGDLTMDFLSYPVVAEEAAESYKTLNCRKLVLRSPENKLVRVWIASEYLFPMRAEFFGEAAAGKLNCKPERILEITGFEKVNNYYVATDIALYSNAFRSRIAFKNCTADKSDSPQAKKAFSEKSL